MKQYSAIVAVGAVIIFLILAFNSSITLSPGEKGVIFRPFTTGLDKENIFSSGFYIIAPWNKMFVYDVQEQQSEETMDVLDKNGLSVNVDISVRYYPIFTKIGDLHEKFGEDYKSKLVIPEVRSSVRRVMGRYTAEEIYSTKRNEVEQAIINETKEVLRTEQNNIEMTALLIRSINLPEQIKVAIENKLKQEQEYLAYQFKLQTADSEAKRLEIEANGMAVYNDILNKSLTDKLLKMKGIEATLLLSESPNAKIIVVGGTDGLPLILGGN